MPDCRAGTVNVDVVAGSADEEDRKRAGEQLQIESSLSSRPPLDDHCALEASTPPLNNDHIAITR